MAGAFGGIKGQIVHHIHDGNRRTIRSPSLEAWLETFLISLEAGLWKKGADGYWEEKLGEDLYPADYPKHFTSADR